MNVETMLCASWIVFQRSTIRQGPYFDQNKNIRQLRNSQFDKLPYYNWNILKIELERERVNFILKIFNFTILFEFFLMKSNWFWLFRMSWHSLLVALEYMFYRKKYNFDFNLEIYFIFSFFLDCKMPQGFKSGKLPDSAFSASSSDATDRPYKARLDFNGKWCPHKKGIGWFFKLNGWIFRG